MTKPCDIQGQLLLLLLQEIGQIDYHNEAV